MSKHDKNCVVVGRMSAALSDMEVSEGAALWPQARNFATLVFRPTKTATLFGSGLSGLGSYWNRLPGRQSDFECRTLANLALRLDPAMMLLDNTVRKRQPQTGAFAHRLGRKKRIEYPFQVFRRYAFPGIGEFDPDHVIFRSGADCNFSVVTLADGMGSIDQHVHEHLVELGSHALHRGDGAVCLDHFSVVLDFAVDDIEGTLDTLMQVDILPFRLIDMREILEVLHDLLHPRYPLGGFPEQVADILREIPPIRFLLQRTDFLQQRLTGQRRFGAFINLRYLQHFFHIQTQAAKVGIDITDRIIDLMRHARRQLADGSHFFRLQQLVMRGFQFFDECLLFFL